MNHVEKVNTKIQVGEISNIRIMTGSLDVANLYGSISTLKARQIVREQVLKSSCSWDGVNCRWALIYLKLTMKPIKIVEQRL